MGDFGTWGGEKTSRGVVEKVANRGRASDSDLQLLWPGLPLHLRSCCRCQRRDCSYYYYYSHLYCIIITTIITMLSARLRDHRLLIIVIILI